MKAVFHPSRPFHPRNLHGIHPSTLHNYDDFFENTYLNGPNRERLSGRAFWERLIGRAHRERLSGQAYRERLSGRAYR